MKLDARSGGNKKAIEDAILMDFENVVDESEKVTRVIGELMTLVASFDRGTEDYLSALDSLVVLTKLGSTLLEHHDFFETESLKAIVVPCLLHRVEFLRKIQSDPIRMEQYVQETQQYKISKRTEYQEHRKRVEKRLKEDKSLSLVSVALSEVQQMAIDRLFEYLDMMKRYDISYTGIYTELSVEEQAEHPVTMLLDHRVDDIPISTYLRRGHIDKLTEVVTVEGNDISLWYILACALDGVIISSSLSLIEELLFNFKEVLYENDENLKSLIRKEYVHELIPFIRHRERRPCQSISVLLSKALMGVRLINEYPKLFTYSSAPAKVAMLPYLASNSNSVGIIKEHVNLIAHGTAPQQDHLLNALIEYPVGVKLILESDVLRALVMEHARGDVAAQFTYYEAGVDCFQYHPEFFTILDAHDQRLVVMNLSESRQGVHCLNTFVDFICSYLSNVKDVILSPSFLLNIAKHDTTYHFFSDCLLSKDCYHLFAQRFLPMMLMMRPKDTEKILYELSLTERGVQFLINQLSILFNLPDEKKQICFTSAFMTNVFSNDQKLLFVWGFYLHPHHEAEFRRVFSSHRRLQKAFFPAQYMDQRVAFLLQYPAFLNYIDPQTLMSVSYTGTASSLAQHIKEHYPDLLKDYKAGASLSIMTARRLIHSASHNIMLAQRQLTGRARPRTSSAPNTDLPQDQSREGTAPSDDQTPDLIAEQTVML